MSTVPEVIARLDAFERALAGMVMEIREYKHMLFDTLDNDLDELVD